jgi:hypothetical protein
VQELLQQRAFEPSEIRTIEIRTHATANTWPTTQQVPAGDRLRALGEVVCDPRQRLVARSCRGGMTRTPAPQIPSPRGRASNSLRGMPVSFS